MASSGTTSASYDPSLIFRRALNSFIESLPAEERKEFQSYGDARSMLQSMQRMAAEDPINQSRMTAACRKFESFVARLRPFFDVVDIFVQVKPEVMALIWGSLRMIFKLCSHYVSFLEKIAGVFEEIAFTLPIYQDYIKLLHSKVRAQHYSYENVTRALGLFYTDILRFCHSTYLLFAKPHKSLVSKLGFIGRTVWRPFNERHQKLLERIMLHRGHLDAELNRTLGLEALDFFNEYAKSVHATEFGTESPRSIAARERRETMAQDAQVRTLQKWIDPPSWSKSLEDAQRARAPGTGNWISDHQIYKQWRKASEMKGTSLGARTLNIQGKPGYGKTVLCSTIIEDLGTFAFDTDSTAVHHSHSVVFYFFDTRRMSWNRPTDAIRAMLAQLLHLHRYNKKAIDVVSVIRDARKTGEFFATVNEVLAVFELLLDHLDFTYLVFDGLDECEDTLGLFKVLRQVAHKAQNAALLFIGRPSVLLPISLAKDCSVIHLTSTGQSEHDRDIGSMLRFELEEMCEEGLFLGDLSVDKIVADVVARSNGMFLWTKLLLKYLSLESLTVAERMDAVTNLNRLEGLDALYGTILANIERLYPGKSLGNISRLFQFVAYSNRRLDVNELHKALSVPLDRPQTKEDSIPRFEETLGRLSGSLIEICSDRTVQFIHLSTQEYFIQISNLPTPGRISPSSQHSRVSLLTTSKILTPRGIANRSLAASCIAYLVNGVPARPLGGSSQTLASQNVVRKKYPFLQYAARNWSLHLANALMIPSTLESGSERIGDTSWGNFIELLAKFLGTRQITTMWIEASWLDGRRPTIEVVKDGQLVDRFETEEFSAHRESLRSVLRDLRDLQNDLDVLSTTWGYILSQESNEIWEPSVPAFTQSRFWMAPDAATISRLPLAAQDTIIVTSKVCLDGQHMAVVKLNPPSGWTADAGPDYDGKWKARYELWELRSSKLMFAVGISLPDHVVLPYKAHGLRKVSVPLSLSDDLSRLAIFDTVIYLAENTNDPRYCGDGHSALTEMRYQIVPEIEEPTPKNYVKFVGHEFAASDYLKWPLEAEKCHTFDQLKFSPSGRYLLVIRHIITSTGGKYSPLSPKHNKTWFIQVLGDISFDSKNRSKTGPNYVCLASTTVFVYEDTTYEAVDRPRTMRFAFHPTLPRLAFSHRSDGRTVTYLWDFEKPFRGHDTSTSTLAAMPNPFPLYYPNIRNPRFTIDGRYLYGTVDGSPVMVGVPEYEPLALLQDNPTKGGLSAAFQIDHLGQPTSLAAAALELACLPQQASQKANVLNFTRGKDGVTYISQLQQLENEGAITLKTLGTNGLLRVETLARLPDTVRSCVHASVVHSSDDDGLVRIVLNKANNGPLTEGDIGNDVLPAIIERKKSSVPAFNFEVPLVLGFKSLDQQLLPRRLQQQVYADDENQSRIEVS